VLVEALDDRADRAAGIVAMQEIQVDAGRAQAVQALLQVYRDRLGRDPRPAGSLVRPLADQDHPLAVAAGVQPGAYRPFGIAPAIHMCGIEGVAAARQVPVEQRDGARQIGGGAAHGAQDQAGQGLGDPGHRQVGHRTVQDLGHSTLPLVSSAGIDWSSRQDTPGRERLAPMQRRLCRGPVVLVQRTRSAIHGCG
jgi:hypothetical protein